MKYYLISAFLFSSVCLQAQTIFEEFDGFLKGHVDSRGMVDYDNVDPQELLRILDLIDSYPFSEQSEESQKAFFINAYNILVISSVVEKSERISVQNQSNFFDEKSHRLGGKVLSLNQLEKEMLFVSFPDPRLHFVLVCGAVSCPPIINEAYFPSTLDRQLNRQTKSALNHWDFIRFDSQSNTLEWSALFDWYSSDFGGNAKGIIQWINSFREVAIPLDAKVKVMDYDWSLNLQMKIPELASNQFPGAKNSIRYVVSSTIKKGSTETKIFNNLYTQLTGDGTTLNTRTNFFTTFITSLYGVSDRFNAGLELRYRRVSSAGYGSSALAVFEDSQEPSHRQSLSTIGPKIRWAPVPKWGNFSIQSGFWFPLESDLEGSAEKSYIDWNGFTSWTQIMNDFTIGQNFSLFAEVDFLWEDIGSGGQAEDLNRMSTPLTLIASYFPEPKTTIYLLNGFSPYWSPELDWFYQGGVGAKHQFSRKFEIELLYTRFTNSFLIENNGRAATFNFGIRVNT